MKLKPKDKVKVEQNLHWGKWSGKTVIVTKINNSPKFSSIEVELDNDTTTFDESALTLVEKAVSFSL
jgi:hypothetical protein